MNRRQAKKVAAALFDVHLALKNEYTGSLNSPEPFALIWPIQEAFSPKLEFKRLIEITSISPSKNDYVIQKLLTKPGWYEVSTTVESVVFYCQCREYDLLEAGLEVPDA